MRRSVYVFLFYMILVSPNDLNKPAHTHMADIFLLTAHSRNAGSNFNKAKLKRYIPAFNIWCFCGSFADFDTGNSVSVTDIIVRRSVASILDCLLVT